MNKLLSLLVALTAFSCFSQTYNVPYRKGNLWGFADKNGKIIIEPKYDSVNPNMENFRWFVYKNGKTGIINTEGIERLAVEYDSIFRIPVHSQNNEFLVYKNGKSGYSDINGRFILATDYHQIIKCDDETFNRFGMKFFVKSSAESNWDLIDENKNVLEKEIETFRNFHRAQYKLKTNGKYGIYNTLTKKWTIQPEYDSIKPFDYKDFYRPKKEFNNIGYFGFKNNTIVLFTKEYTIITTKLNKEEDFFELPKNDENEDFAYTAVDHPISRNSNSRFVSVTGENFTKGMRYQTNWTYYTDAKFFTILKEKNSYGISVGFNNSSIEFDEIKALKDNYDEKFNKEIVMVRKNKKWGIYNYIKMKLIAPIAYDSFEIHKRYENFIILKIKNKIGLFEIEDDRDKETSTAIEPLYDDFKALIYVRSNDYEYNNFNVYYFVKNGKLCPVGINGVKFYED
ncbi:WG repeat-containing protein [Flavobacterium pedocola]